MFVACKDMLKVRNKKVIQELLKDKNVSFQKISVASNLEYDQSTKDILALAKQKNISIEKVARNKMAQRRSGETREALIAFLHPLKKWGFNELLDYLYENNEEPFFLFLNKVDFANNIGLIARTAFAAGVNGLIFQDSREAHFEEEALHFSMGALARIPHIKVTVFEGLKECNKNGIRTACLDMEGASYFKEDLSGPLALVLGAEREGISSKILKTCDQTLSIPMKNGIDSLNVSTSTAIVLYEKLRQEAMTFKK